MIWPVESGQLLSDLEDEGTKKLPGTRVDI